jgi:glycine C-acetyltransferase
MSKKNFYKTLSKEIERIDTAGTAKRHELVIERFDYTKGRAPRAVVKGKKYLVFNSNDYLGLRLHPKVIEAEHKAGKQYGAGPGAVRFISGTHKIHRELEKKIAQFHKREACMVLSSTFALNFGVLHALIKGQSRESMIGQNTLVISDQLNHRSIIDGIRVANLAKEQKVIFKHLDMPHLHDILEAHSKKVDRVIIVTDGVFSMLGEHQDLASLEKTARMYEKHFSEGVITVVDDAHGVASSGKTGRGTEEVCNTQCDLLIGTLGKGFGTDGGYIVGKKIFIDYFRESVATYIYSNPISPGTAGAALQAIMIVDSYEGKRLITTLQKNVALFKKRVKEIGFSLAVNSLHAIQPLLIGDALKTKKIVRGLFKKGVIVTNISYPVVSKGKDEIRIQLSAAHTEKDIDELIKALKKSMKLKETYLNNINVQ